MRPGAGLNGFEAGALFSPVDVAEPCVLKNIRGAFVIDGTPSTPQGGAGEPPERDSLASRVRLSLVVRHFLCRRDGGGSCHPRAHSTQGGGSLAEKGIAVSVGEGRSAGAALCTERELEEN